MGWMEKGERRAREQVRDFVSGPNKGNKVLENGSGGKGERRLQAPGVLFPFSCHAPAPSGYLAWESSFTMCKTEDDSDPSGAERDSRSGQRCLPPPPPPAPLPAAARAVLSPPPTRGCRTLELRAKGNEEC